MKRGDGSEQHTLLLAQLPPTAKLAAAAGAEQEIIGFWQSPNRKDDLQVYFNKQVTKLICLGTRFAPGPTGRFFTDMPGRDRARASAANLAETTHSGGREWTENKPVVPGRGVTTSPENEISIGNHVLALRRT